MSWTDALTPEDIDRLLNIASYYGPKKLVMRDDDKEFVDAICKLRRDEFMLRELDNG